MVLCLQYSCLTQAWQGFLPELVKCLHGHSYLLQGPWVLPLPSVLQLFSLVNPQCPVVFLLWGGIKRLILHFPFLVSPAPHSMSLWLLLLFPR